MIKRKQLLSAILLFILIYIALLLVGQPLRESYARGFRSVGQWLSNKTIPSAALRFEAHPDPGKYALTTKVVLLNEQHIHQARETGSRQIRGAEMYWSSWYGAFLPTLLLVALFLATPVPWRRRTFALLWGLLFFHLFLFLKLYVGILNECNLYDWLEVGQLHQPFWKSLLKTANSILVANFETSFVMPVIIWGAVSFRKLDRTFR